MFILWQAQDLSIEMYTTLEEQKESMLEAAYQCYLHANKVCMNPFLSDISLYTTLSKAERFG